MCVSTASRSPALPVSPHGVPRKDEAKLLTKMRSAPRVRLPLVRGAQGSGCTSGAEIMARSSHFGGPPPPKKRKRPYGGTKMCTAARRWRRAVASVSTFAEAPTLDVTRAVAHRLLECARSDNSHSEGLGRGRRYELNSILRSLKDMAEGAGPSNRVCAGQSYRCKNPAHSVRNTSSRPSRCLRPDNSSR